MIDDDDDLPVLTQVLRTGHPDIGEPVVPAADDRLADALDPRTAAAANRHDAPLVIGHEPRRDVDEDPALSFDVSPPLFLRGASAHDEIDAPLAVDAFVLPQDHDATLAAGPSFDEPEYAVEPPEAPLEPLHASALHDPAPAFNQRVRDAVLENLGARIGTELDARVAQAIHIELETALAQLQAGLRTQLAEALRDVVGRAVDEEIARLAARPADGA